MWGCLKVFFICWVIIAIMVFISDDKPKEPAKKVEAYKNVRPDPNRKVLRFDWDNNKYIYQDEVKPEKKGKKFRNYEPYPDAFVQGLPSDDPIVPKKDQIVTLNGHRYRVWHKLNGEIELILLK
jgi:hypothetical protein